MKRREFLEQSIPVALAAGMPAALAAADDEPRSLSGEALIQKMTWLNPPQSTRWANGQLIVRSRAKTDFWRKTFYGYITDNGHFLSLPVDGDFTFQARISGKYADQYDQAGLMVRIDAQQWIKCGTELVDKRRNASVVFTRDFSDWSTLPDLSQSAPVWWRAVRQKDSIETQCSLDGKSFMTVRQGYFPPRIRASVGIMCAAPEGKGFDALFDEVLLTAHPGAKKM
jgi:uncharacterized protein